MIDAPSHSGGGQTARRAALVDHARQSIARGSRSFGLASRLFDRQTRERAWLLYAWCRACDDMADGQDHGRFADDSAGVDGGEDEAKELAVRIRALTDLALAGEPTGHAAFDALAQLHREVPLPRPFIDALLQGFDRDADGWRPRSEADLFSYCYNVAGAVGCLMAVVMGVDAADDDTLDRACDLGIAFQLANIARDIADDNAMGRLYLPEEWLSEMDIPPGAHMHPAFRPRLGVMARWLAEFAGDYRRSAAIGAARLPFRSRWAVLAASRIYGRIADKVERAGERAWDHRVSTSATEKLGDVASAGWHSLRPPAPDADAVARTRLWSRPRG